MQDKTINNALLALRKQIIRGGGEGLDHVESLLSMRGVDMPRVLPAKRPDAARKGQAQQIVLDALRLSPMALRELSARMKLARPEITHDAAYQRTGQALAKLKSKGVVGRVGAIWRLAP